MPQKEAGCRMDPPVSEPNARIVSSAATADAEPPLDPPGTRSRSRGFLVGLKWEFSVDDPIANSSMFVLPTKIASADRSRSTTVAS